MVTLNNPCDVVCLTFNSVSLAILEPSTYFHESNANSINALISHFTTHRCDIIQVWWTSSESSGNVNFFQDSER